MTRPRAEPVAAAPGLDVQRLREDFPILARTVHGRPLVYLDSAATAQKPQAVLDAMNRFHTEGCANVHRGVHTLGEQAGEAYEQARAKVRQFLNAPEEREVVFAHGATEAINVVAHGYGGVVLGPGDEVVVSAMEHHSNLVPWQTVCRQRGAVLRVAPIDDQGELLLDEYERLLGPRTKLVAVAHVSNVLGTVNPVAEIVRRAHRRGIPVLVDGAQAVPHLAIDVQALDCDFYAFSGHKLYGPFGIGVLYGKAERLDALRPHLVGSGMVATVGLEETTWAPLPHRLEAGTPNIAGAIGLGAALDYVSGIGLEAIAAHEEALLAHAMRELVAIPRLRLIGTARGKAPIVSFVVDGIHPHDLATVLDREGIAIRAGHHCAQPLMERFAVAATARASLALYTTQAEIEALVAGVEKAIAVLG